MVITGGGDEPVPSGLTGFVLFNPCVAVSVQVDLDIDDAVTGPPVVVFDGTDELVNSEAEIEEDDGGAVVPVMPVSVALGLLVLEEIGS